MIMVNQSPEVLGKVVGWVHIYAAGASPYEQYKEIESLEELRRLWIETGFVYTRIERPGGQEKQLGEMFVPIGSQVAALVCGDCGMCQWFPCPLDVPPHCWKCDDL